MGYLQIVAWRPFEEIKVLCYNTFSFDNLIKRSQENFYTPSAAPTKSGTGIPVTELACVTFDTEHVTNKDPFGIYFDLTPATKAGFFILCCTLRCRSPVNRDCP